MLRRSSSFLLLFKHTIIEQGIWERASWGLILAFLSTRRPKPSDHQEFGHYLFVVAMTSSSGVTFVLFCFVFVFMLSLKPRAFVHSSFDPPVLSTCYNHFMPIIVGVGKRGAF